MKTRSVSYLGPTCTCELKDVLLDVKLDALNTTLKRVIEVPLSEDRYRDIEGD